MSKRIILEQMEELEIDQLIRILGQSSATAKAKQMRDERRLKGEAVELFWDRKHHTIVVGPSLVQA